MPTPDRLRDTNYRMRVDLGGMPVQSYGHGTQAFAGYVPVREGVLRAFVAHRFICRVDYKAASIMMVRDDTGNLFHPGTHSKHGRLRLFQPPCPKDTRIHPTVIDHRRPRDLIVARSAVGVVIVHMDVEADQLVNDGSAA